MYDTRSVAKTPGYLLLVIFVPVPGMTFYFSFGINYGKRKIYTKKLLVDESIKAELREKVEAYRKSNILKLSAVIENRPLVALLSHSGMREVAYSRIRKYLCFKTGSSCSLFYWRNWRKRESTFIFPVPELAGRGKAGAGDSQRPGVAILF